MEHTEEEFFAHVKEVIQDYELDYVPGAWERFQQKERKNQLMLWIKWARPIAAAVAVILGFLVWKTSVSEREDNQLVFIEKNIKVEDGLVERPIGYQNDMKTASMPNVPVKIAKFKLNKLKTDLQNVDAALINEIIAVATTTTQIPEVNDQSLEPIDQKYTPLSKHVYRNRHDAFSSLVSNDHKSSTEKGRLWRVNLSVSNDYGPADKLRLGFGSSVEYTFNKKIAISAGVAYIKLTGVDKLDIKTTEREERNLSSIETSVAGIDLPIDVKYNISERSYLSMGISAMNILRKSQTLNYIENKLMQVTVSGVDGLTTESKMVSTFESIPVASESLPEQKRLGFYNFSYGFMQKIGKDKDVIFEPYIKLPMTTYSEQRSKLISAGVRLKVSL